MIILKMIIKKHLHIYQMSYSNNAKKIKNLVNNLNRFCFDSKNIQKLDLLSKIDVHTSKIDVHTSKNHKNIDEGKSTQKKMHTKEFFIPSQNDNLFWCWYIFQNGIKEYSILHNKYFIIEKKRKIDWVPLLRENKASIKQLKYKLSSLENNLVNEKNMHIKTLETICFLNNIDVYIVKNKMLYKNAHDNKDRIILKYYPETKKYGILLDTVDVLKKINTYEEELYLVNDIEKPLKGISSYKLKNLQDIAEKINIELKTTNNNKKKTKKQLYSEIQEQLV